MMFVHARTEKLAGLVFVISLHIALLYCVWTYLLIAPSAKANVLLVNLITAPPERIKPVPAVMTKPRQQQAKLHKPLWPKPVVEATQLLSTTPVALNVEPATSEPPGEIEPGAEQSIDIGEAAETLHESVAPLKLSTLSLTCPLRTPPSYPTASRRMHEQGRVVLRVTLDEAGRVASITVKQSSGFQRLDEAGVAVIKDWKCNAAMRDGVAVRTEALQPFDFILN